MNEETEQLRLTQPLTDATENTLKNAAYRVAEMGDASPADAAFYAACIQLECTRALCAELAGLRAQMALHRLEVAEISTELSDLRLKL